MKMQVFHCFPTTHVLQSPLHVGVHLPQSLPHVSALSSAVPPLPTLYLLHSNYLSRYLDLVFILILTCSHSPFLNPPLPVCPPLSSAMCPWKSQSCRQSFLDPKPAVATFSTPAPLPVQVLSRTGYSSFSGAPSECEQCDYQDEERTSRGCYRMMERTWGGRETGRARLWGQPLRVCSIRGKPCLALLRLGLLICQTKIIKMLHRIVVDRKSNLENN